MNKYECPICNNEVKCEDVIGFAPKQEYGTPQQFCMCYNCGVGGPGESKEQAYKNFLLSANNYKEKVLNVKKEKNKDNR